MYQKGFRMKLRRCKDHNPKVYWTMLQGYKSKEKTKVSLSVLFNHFKDLNECDSTEPEFQNVDVNFRTRYWMLL